MAKRKTKNQENRIVARERKTALRKIVKDIACLDRNFAESLILFFIVFFCVVPLVSMIVVRKLVPTMEFDYLFLIGVAAFFAGGYAFVKLSKFLVRRYKNIRGALIREGREILSRKDE